MIHELKIKEEYFAEILNGNKTYEIRKNDRNYKVHDYLALNEIDRDGIYTERCVICYVIGLVNLKDIGMEDYVAMTIVPCTADAETIGCPIDPM